MEQIYKGSVKWFDDKKGYGFITPESGGNDVFVHFSDISGNGFRTLKEGDLVQYSMGQGERGPKAFNVTRLGADVEADLAI